MLFEKTEMHRVVVDVVILHVADVFDFLAAVCLRKLI